MNQEFLLKIQNMEKEKEVLIQSHENFITETKIYHDNLTKDLEQKIQDIKQENLRELENAYQQRVRMIDEEKKSKEHYKSKVEDLKQKLQSITSDHQDEMHSVIAKNSEQIVECNEENQSKVCIIFQTNFSGCCTNDNQKQKTNLESERVCLPKKYIV
jgi:hypothetical protein